MRGRVGAYLHDLPVAEQPGHHWDDWLQKHRSSTCQHIHFDCAKFQFCDSNNSWCWVFVQIRKDFIYFPYNSKHSVLMCGLYCTSKGTHELAMRSSAPVDRAVR